MSRITFSIDAREVDSLLSTIERKFRRRTVNRGLRTAAKILRAVALPSTPRKTGMLRRALKVRRLRNVPRSTAGIALIIGKKWFAGSTYYGAFVEWGHGIGKRSSGVRAAQREARRTRDRSQRAALLEALRRGDSRSRVPARLMLTNAARMAGAFAAQAAVQEIRREVESIRRGQGLHRGEEASTDG
jgi:hypothetical protein